MALSAAPAAPATAAAASAPDPAARFRQVRARSLHLAAPLSPEDAMVQSMADASPAKWHLAHTTWFFERFVLAARPGYRPVEPDWDYLFNSYYQSAGPMHARPQRGLLSRPTLAQVYDYRAEVDARIARRLEDGDLDEQAQRLLLLGLHHEQQHQELLLTDIKHAFWCNPLRPAYRDGPPQPHGGELPLRWIEVPAQTVAIGAPRWPQDGDAFAYDNESPRHAVLLQGHVLANRPVSHDEYRAFVENGGYRDPALWLSDGWACVQANAWQRPLYWHEDLSRVFTLGGWREADPHAPVCHLSYYEADAYARWAGVRLPTEAEWEHAASEHAASEHAASEHAVARSDPPAGEAASDDALHPRAATAADVDATGFAQLFGGVWEWTASPYTAYPGYRPWQGSIGEYNGKFMCGQWVLRGGSCATAPGHVRASYRNFFPPQARWQFAGLRVARDA